MEEITKEPKNKQSGIKFDQDKPRWDLLPWVELEEVVKVLTNGSRKYKDNNWKYVNEAKRRYLAAAVRHIVSWIQGEKYDDIDKGGDGLHHLSHAICCLLFLMWFDRKETKDEQKDAPKTKDIDVHKKNDWIRKVERKFKNSITQLYCRFYKCILSNCEKSNKRA